jgi:hypothetical protein
MYGILCYNKKPCVYLEIEGFKKKYSDCADRFRIDRRLVKRIFVDETLLLQIDGGQNYWLWWIAYEPNLNVCLMRMVHLSSERRTIFFICYRFFKQLRDRYGSRTPIYFHRWCSMVQ